MHTTQLFSIADLSQHQACAQLESSYVMACFSEDCLVIWVGSTLDLDAWRSIKTNAPSASLCATFCAGHYAGSP